MFVFTVPGVALATPGILRLYTRLVRNELPPRQTRQIDDRNFEESELHDHLGGVAYHAQPPCPARLLEPPGGARHRYRLSGRRNADGLSDGKDRIQPVARVGARVLVPAVDLAGHAPGDVSGGRILRIVDPSPHGCNRHFARHRHGGRDSMAARRQGGDGRILVA